MYTTVKLPMDCTVHQVISHVKRKLSLANDHILCEVKSTGGRLQTRLFDGFVKTKYYICTTELIQYCEDRIIVSLNDSETI